MAARFDTAVAEAQKRQNPEGVQRMLLAKYREATGKPAPEVGGVEFRDLMIDVMTDQDMK